MDIWKSQSSPFGTLSKWPLKLTLHEEEKLLANADFDDKGGDLLTNVVQQTRFEPLGSAIASEKRNGDTFCPFCHEHAVAQGLQNTVTQHFNGRRSSSKDEELIAYFQQATLKPSKSITGGHGFLNMEEKETWFDKLVLATIPKQQRPKVKKTAV